jgi:hypothetical protein
MRRSTVLSLPLLIMFLACAFMDRVTVLSLPLLIMFLACAFMDRVHWRKIAGDFALSLHV